MAKFYFSFIISFLITLSGLCSDTRSLYYYDDQSLKELSQQGDSLVFFSTGWSGSGMGKMYKRKTRIKQVRGFAIAYRLALRMHHLGIKGKVFYLTTKAGSKRMKKYLFHQMQIVTGNLIPMAMTNSFHMNDQEKMEMKKFEENYFEEVIYSVDNLKKNLAPTDEGRFMYLFEGTNANVTELLREKVDKLKNENAFFGGIEYHFGGPFFQEFKQAMGLDEMLLRGSEIYDAIGDEDPYDIEDVDDSKGKEEANDNEYNDIEIENFLSRKRKIESTIPKDLGTKSQCRRLYRDLKINHARGSYIAVHDIDILVKEIYDFFKDNRDVFNLVIKLERSSAGDGNITYKFKSLFDKNPTFWSDENLAIRELKAFILAKFTVNYERRMHDHGAVFEAFIEGEKFSSPAVLGMIMENSVEVYFDYNQILGGPNGQTYMGSMGPASNQHLKDFGVDKNGIKETNLREPSLAILEGLRVLGARGAVGIDFVTCDEIGPDRKKVRNYYAIENNVRHTGTMYPFRTFFYLVGREIMDRSYFASTDSVKVVDIKPGREDMVKKWFYQVFLPENIYTYRPQSENGCIVYMDTWELGKIGIACIADTQKKLTKIFDGFKESITTSVKEYVEGTEL